MGEARALRVLFSHQGTIIRTKFPRWSALSGVKFEFGQLCARSGGEDKAVSTCTRWRRRREARTRPRRVKLCKLPSSLPYHISPVVLRKYRYSRKSKKIFTTKPIVNY